MTNITSNIKRYLLPIPLFLGITGCHDLFDLFDNKDKHFPLEEKYKIKFNERDTLNYLDQHGNSFQLVVSKIVYDTRTVSRKGSSGPYNIYDHEKVFYDSLNRTTSPSSAPVRNIYTDQPSNHVMWEPGLYGSGTVPYFEQLTLNSITYRSVFKYSADPRPPGLITTWYYSYTYGFVAFERANGQLFTLMIP